MRKKLIRLIDVKSIVTLSLMAVMVTAVIRNSPIDDKLFSLYSNITSMVITYFFTKKQKEDDNT